MRSSSNGPFATLLMLVPLVAVPLLAVIGIPDLSPLSASPSNAEAEASLALKADIGASARHSADDLFAPISFRNRGSSNASNHADSNRQGVEHANDPFSQAEFHGNADDRGPARSQDASPASAGNARAWNPPSNATNGGALAGRQRDAAVGNQPVDSRQNVNSTAGDPAQGFVRNAVERWREPNMGHSAPDAGKGRAREGAEAAQNPHIGYATVSGRGDSRDPIGGLPKFEQDPRPGFAGQPPLLSERMLASTQPDDNRSQAGRTADGSPHHAGGDHASAAAEPAGIESTMTWQSAIERLNRHGIQHYQLQPGQNPNEFHFSCSFTPEDNPRITHRFEAEASEPLRAVEKVIQQVEQWRSRRSGQRSTTDNRRANNDVLRFSDG